jgi:transketolase
MRVDPANPQWEGRDRFVLSKGHAAPALYAVLANRGFFPADELKTLRHVGSRLQGHPNMNLTPGVDMSTGSLGQGVSCAAGIALGAKKRNSDARVYTLSATVSSRKGRSGRP